MPTKWLSVGTTLVKLIEADPNRTSFSVKFPRSQGTRTTHYARLSDDAGGCDQDEAWCLECGEALHFSKADGDRVDKAWYARTASGTCTICIIENFEIPKPESKWW